MTTLRRYSGRRLVCAASAVIALAIATVALANWYVAPVPAGFDPAITLAQARQTAALNHRAVVIVATADYCPVCQGFKRHSLSDPQVTQWLEENAETVWLVAGRDDAAIAALGITVFPTTILDVGGGYSLASITGSVQPWILVEQLTVARDRTRQEFCPPGMF